MGKEEYRSCMSTSMKGKTGLTKEERRNLFCETSQICSGKASNQEEARARCQEKREQAKTKIAQPKKERQRDNFSCNINIKPLEEWLQQPEAPDHCPPCLITPLAEMYLDALKGDKRAAASLKRAWETGDALTIAAAMDKIKGEVGDDLRNQLRSLDCQAQSFKASA